MFSKIETRSQALKMIKECFFGFLFVAFLSVLSGFILTTESFIDAAIFAILGLALMFLKSRIAAILLTIFSGITVITTITNIIGTTNVGGTNLFLAFIILWVAIRSVDATFKLHGQFAGELDEIHDDEWVDLNIPENESSEPGFTVLQFVVVTILLVLLCFAVLLIFFVTGLI